MNTKVHYLYCDASNYKFRGSFIVAGAFDPAAIDKFLIDGEFFVPKAIGVAALVPKCRNEDDHDWHTFEECEPTEAPAVMTAQELIRRIKRASAAEWPVG